MTEEGYDFTVDWGDESTSRITSWNSPDKTHTYENPGTYTLKITGQIEGFRFAGHSRGGNDARKIIRITKWGPLKLGNLGAYFSGAHNLADITDRANLTGTTNLSKMFEYAHNFNGDINNWNVSSATSMGINVLQGRQLQPAPQQLEHKLSNKHAKHVRSRHQLQPALKQLEHELSEKHAMDVQRRHQLQPASGQLGHKLSNKHALDFQRRHQLQRRYKPTGTQAQQET